MRFNLHARLHTLHCISPEDENGDEPYMFTFYVRADGTTLRQSLTNPGHLIPSLTVVSPPGAHGNLGVEDLLSKGDVQVPPAVGSFDTMLTPIAFTFTDRGRQVQAFIPGRLVAIAALLEEDWTSDSVANALHAAVTAHVQARINEFFGGVDLNPTITTALQDPGPPAQKIANVRNAVNTFLAQQVAVFRAQLRSELTDLAINVVIKEAFSDFNVLGTLLENAIDRDDMLDTGQVLFAEDAMIQGNLNANATNELREESTGLDGAWYILYSSAHADLAFDLRDVEINSKVGTPIKGTPTNFTPPRAQLCVSPEPVEVSSDFIPQLYDLLTTYPFCRYRYLLEGQELRANEGFVTFPARTSLQELDPTAFPFVKLITTTKDVTVNFQVVPDPFRPQLQHLVLSNVPADGTYSFTLKVEAVLPNGRAIPVTEFSRAFQGQVITFPPGYISRIRKCRKDFTDKFSESVTVGPKELWGPYGREQRYAEIQTFLDTYVSRLGASPQRVERLRALVGKALGR